MAEDARPKPVPPRILVEWDDAGDKHLAVEGNVTPDHMAVAAFLITSLAQQMLTAQMEGAMRAGSAAPAIIPIHQRLDHEARA